MRSSELVCQHMNDYEQRPGEIRLPFDPAERAADASVTFVGRIRSPWKDRSECPKNMAQARESRRSARLEIDSVWRPGLEGLQDHGVAIVLYWMDQARRDLIVQRPRHRGGRVGVFGLRSPARPNPIALAVVRIVAIDQAEGTVEIDAIDCLDGTPLLDIKPWLKSVDYSPDFS
ncbi:MAG: tRNA (N6-threonylcarbamoyladenosine(37)-N6)-methyltransferase TrmO [Hyphomicrobiaceae bacterium]